MKSIQQSFIFSNVGNPFKKIKWKFLGRRKTRVKETKEVYSVDSKKYTKERHSMHKKIVNNIVSKASASEKGKKPIAILIGGGTASGKTTMRKTIIEKELSSRQIHAATVDPDNIKEYIPEYASFKKIHPDQAARLVHKESCDIGALLLKQLIRNRKHLVYEGTMAKTRKYKWLINQLKMDGYEIHAYIVDVPLAVAKEREDERASITGRKVPHYIIENTHKLVPKTVEAIKDLVDSFQVYDNQNGLTLIAANHYVEPKKYKEFLKKGKIKYHGLSKTTESRRMFDISHTNITIMKVWIAEQKRQKKTTHIFIDDCHGDDILDREYPN